MTVGAVIGKFYPFHLGHDLLIRRAKSEVDHLVVIVSFRPGQELPGELRASWIESEHPDIDVLLAEEDVPDEPLPWAGKTIEILGRRPDVVFTSEEYGVPWSDAMGSRHVLVDLTRSAFPVSGTMLRSDLGAYWHMLTPPAKAFFARRVCVLGVESSGTTTMCKALAEHFSTAWVPEYGRQYWEARRHLPSSVSWSEREFVRIARGQLYWEEDMAHLANRVLFCDTDPLATLIWQRRYAGVRTAELDAIVSAKDYDLYLLTSPDFGFIQDGTRESEHVRMEMHAWFLEELQARGRRFVVLSGAVEDRVQNAIEAVEGLVAFEPLSAPYTH